MKEALITIMIVGLIVGITLTTLGILHIKRKEYERR